MTSTPHAPPPARHLIAGQLQDSPTHFEVIDPATGQPFATCPRATRAQLDQAVAAARGAWAGWRAEGFQARGERLRQLARALREQGPELAPLLTREQGKPLARAREEFERSAQLIDGITQLALAPELLRSDERGKATLHHEPLGVVGAITPWNTPIVLGVSKIVQALYTGNTLVLKPSPCAPLTTLRLGELARDLFPAGVLNLLAGDADMGGWMTAHPDIDKISFTGSVRTGKAVMAACAGTLKRFTLELGGNDAAIVLDDADVAAIAPQLFWTAFANSGQVCMAIKRLYVQRPVYEKLVAELAGIAARVKVGAGSDPATELGPLQNRMQYDIVRGILDDTRSSGARVLQGGQALPAGGYFIAPAIVADAVEGMRVVDEEPFGPILPVLAFDNEADAIRRANDTPYGLGSSVWSANLDRAQAVATHLRAGTTWINSHMGVEPGVPFGGVKQSGMGVEYALQGLKGYMEPHVIKTPARG